MATFRVVVTDVRFRGFDEERALLEPIGAELVLADCATAQQVAEVGRDADALLANLAPVDAIAIAGLGRCKVIARYGVGFDSVDVAAATKKGIWVANVPDYCAEDVSDHAVALLLSCARNVARTDRAVRAGRWNVSVTAPLHRLRGRTLGLVGFGRIARITARKLAGFNLGRVLAYDPFLDAAAVAAAGAEQVELDQLMAEADLISVHAPLTPATRGLIHAGNLAQCRGGSILVNTSRGGLIVQDDLVAALAGGTLAAAALDVFAEEPLPADAPIRRLDNAVLTDHCGWYSEESMSELKTKAASNVVATLTTGRPLTPVNQILSAGGAPP